MKKNFNIIIRTVFTVVIIYFLLNSIRIIYDVKEVEKQANDVSQSLENAEEKVAKLKHRYEAPVDDEYMERVAKENGYHFPDEIIFYNNFGK